MSRSHSRGRALRTGVAWDMKTGMKTRGRKLMSDGERPGVYTEKGWVDQRHPSRYVNVPPPDGLNYRPGPPAMHAIGARVDLSWVVASDTSYASTDADTQQGVGVLRRASAPWMFAYLDDDAIFVGEHPGIPSGDLLWGGWELQWGGADLVWGGV